MVLSFTAGGLINPVLPDKQVFLVELKSRKAFKNVFCYFPKYKSLNVVDIIMAPQRHSHPNSWNLDYVIFHGKRYFADVIKVRILIWEDHPGLSGWAWCHHKDPYKRRSESVVDGVVESEAGGFKNGGREGHLAGSVG